MLNPQAKKEGEERSVEVFSSPVHIHGKTTTEERLGSRSLRTLINLVFCYLCLPLLQCDLMSLDASVIKIVLGPCFQRSSHWCCFTHALLCFREDFSQLHYTQHLLNFCICSLALEFHRKKPNHQCCVNKIHSKTN